MALNKPSSRAVAIGLDFGTESVRALLVAIETGEEIAESTHTYRHGVISRSLPSSGAELPPETALQDPRDYIESMKHVLSEVLEKVDSADVTGIGIDFTACTMLPVKRDGTPLCMDPRFANEPHAYVKLWKHHGAQDQADRANRLARSRNEPFLSYYGGGISSEWMIPKCLQVLEESPVIFGETDYFVEAGDWIVERMTGRFTRNSTAAGYKGAWSAEHGFPSETFLSELHPEFPKVLAKWTLEVEAPGTRAGSVTASFAAETGLSTGTAVSIATIDAHSGVAGMGVYGEGALAIILGTSSCHMALSREFKPAPGVAGIVKDGILPGFYGYESGQAAVGDAFGWFARKFTGLGFEALSKEARALAPGESGLLALDGWNGNRTPYMDSRVSGALIGLTLSTTPAEKYRALIESTAFGTRRIAELHRNAGIPIDRLVVCGGLVQDPLILRIYADVTGLPVHVASSNQAVALGAAIFGARAASGEDLESLITRMTKAPRSTVKPDPAATPVYDQLYSAYRELEKSLWSSSREWMHSLRALRETALQRKARA